MKSKSIVKQYCSDNVKKLVVLVLIALSSILLLVSIPVLIKFIADMFYKVVESNAEISQLEAYLKTLETLSNTITEQTALQAIQTEMVGLNTQLKSLNEIVNKSMVTGIILTASLGVSAVLSFYVSTVFKQKETKLGSEITNELRYAAFSSLMRGELYEIRDVSIEDLRKNVLDSTSKIGNDYYSKHIMNIFYYVALFSASLITIFCFDSICGLVALALAPMYYLIHKYMRKIANKKNDNYEKQNTEQEDYIKYNVNNLKSIKVRNAVEKEEKIYKDLLEDTKKYYDSNKLFLNLNKDLIINLVVNVLLCCVIGIFLWELSNQSEKFAFGNFVACLVLCPIAFNSFKNLADCYMNKQNINETFNSLNQILDLKVESRSETINFLEEVHSLSFNNVSFDYANINQKGVEKINFEVKKGEKIGILGYQKSGKTTIADLICKLIRPRFGNVLINNCDINKLSTKFLRDIIAYVPQNFSLCDGTIEKNIIYPMDLDEYKYNDALNKCKLKTLLMNLPKRDQENVKDIKLSPSDIEKIGLAHALYKDSPIIVLDEATSKLDQQTESEIMGEFYKLKNKITIVISNRITTLLKCDKILILNDGKVVEYGKTEDLINDKRSTYSKMIGDINRKIV